MQLVKRGFDCNAGKTFNMYGRKVMIRLYPPLLVALLLPVLGEGARGLGLGHTHATSRSPTSNDLDTRSGDTQFPAMHSSFAFPSTDASLSRRKLRDKTSLGMAAQRHLLNHMQGTPPAPARGARQTGAQPGPSPSMATSKVTAESTNPTVLGDDGIGVNTSNPISVSNPITVKSPSSSASGGGGLGGGGLLSSLLAGTAGGVAGGMASGPLPLPFGRRM